MQLKKGMFKFLKDLDKNNNREWFAKNKDTYLVHHEAAKAFFQAVRDELDKTDLIEKHRTYRIYRDVRFSKDKLPYNPRFAGGYVRATAKLRGGYYLQLMPGNSLFAGGFFSPNPDDTKRIRKEFEFDDTPMRKIMKQKKFKTTFGDLQGHEVKTSPRGFDIDHKAIDLIKKKQFYFEKTFTDQEVFSPEFFDDVMDAFKTIRPFFNYMSDVLTTNMNGESIL